MPTEASRTQSATQSTVDAVNVRQSTSEAVEKAAGPKPAYKAEASAFCVPEGVKIPAWEGDIILTVGMGAYPGDRAGRTQQYTPRSYTTVASKRPKTRTHAERCVSTVVGSWPAEHGSEG